MTEYELRQALDYQWAQMLFMVGYTWEEAKELARRLSDGDIEFNDIEPFKTFNEEKQSK